MVSEAQVTEYLRQHPAARYERAISLSNASRPISLGSAFASTAGTAQCILKTYEPAARESARREAAGLKLAGNMGLSPALLRADEAGAALGGPILIAEAPSGEPLGTARMTDQNVQDWLFLLLTLHHLPADAASFPSSMSPDATTWWRRTQSSWEACKPCTPPAAIAH